MEDMAAREEKAGSWGRGREGSQAAMHRQTYCTNTPPPLAARISYSRAWNVHSLTMGQDSSKITRFEA